MGRESVYGCCFCVYLFRQCFFLLAVKGLRPLLLLPSFLVLSRLHRVACIGGEHKGQHRIAARPPQTQHLCVGVSKHIWQGQRGNEGKKYVLPMLPAQYFG